MKSLAHTLTTMKAVTLCFFLLVSSIFAIPVPDECETTLTPDKLRELLESRWSELPPSPTRSSRNDDSFDRLGDLDATLTVIERVRKVLDSESPVESSFLLRIPELNQHKSHQHGDKQRSTSLPSM